MFVTGHARRVPKQPRTAHHFVTPIFLMRDVRFRDCLRPNLCMLLRLRIVSNLFRRRFGRCEFRCKAGPVGWAWPSRSRNCHLQGVRMHGFRLWPVSEALEVSWAVS